MRCPDLHGRRSRPSLVRNGKKGKAGTNDETTRTQKAGAKACQSAGKRRDAACASPIGGGLVFATNSGDISENSSGNTVTIEGETEESLTWQKLDETGLEWALAPTNENYATLKIRGEGAMPDWDGRSNTAPWASYSSKITAVVVEDGVTSIGSCAFSDFSQLVSVALPDSVEKIGDCAFDYCTSLTEIVLPKNLAILGAGAFQSTGLEKITLPDKVTEILEYTFLSCKKLETIELLGQVTTFGEKAFLDCPSLKSITWPDSLTTIGTQAFYRCTSLGALEGDAPGSLVLPSGLTTIGDYAFQECTSLSAVEMPDDLTTIGEYAFSGCKSLSKVRLSPKLTTWGMMAFVGCEGLSTVIVPEGMTVIGAGAFYECAKLTSIQLPDSLKEIGNGAFYSTGLTKVVLPQDLESLGNMAFANCTDLAEVYAPANPKLELGTGVFDGCARLAAIYIPAGMEELYREAGWPEAACYYSIAVSSADGGTAEASSAWGEAGAEVELTAKPAEGYRFAGWEITSGNVQLEDNKTNPVTFNMPAGAVTVKAIWELDQYTVAAEAMGDGTGTVRVSDDEKTDEASLSVPAGQQVTVTATPAEGSHFAGWRVEPQGALPEEEAAASAGEVEWSFAMPEADVKVQAVFAAHQKDTESGIQYNETSHWWLCADCGAQIELALHTGTEEWTVTKEPTETEAGEEARICEDCGYILETRPIDATGSDPEPDPEPTPEPEPEPTPEPEPEPDTPDKPEIPEEPETPNEPAAPDEPEAPAQAVSDGNAEALIGVAAVAAGGAALLAYHYREALPIWKLAGVIRLAADDTAVANAVVTLLQNGEVVKTLTTDANGYFTARVPKGTYELVADWEQDGVAYTKRAEVVVDRVAGDIRVHEILLEEGEAPQEPKPAE